MFIFQEYIFMGALLLSVLTSISIPPWPVMHIAQTHLGRGAVIHNSIGLSEIRFGIWGICYYDLENELTCENTKNVTITQGKNVASVDWGKIKSSLLVQPIFTAVSVLMILPGIYDALCQAINFPKNRTPFKHTQSFRSAANVIATIALAAVFITHIVFYNRIRSDLRNLGPTELNGIGFALTSVSFFLSLLVCVYFNSWRGGIKKSEGEDRRDRQVELRNLG